MFADPQSVTINAVPFSLPRTESDGTKSLYATADESLKMTISHQETNAGRTRRMVRLDQRVVAADPISAANSYQTLGVYIVIDEPEYGFSDTVIDQLVQGFKAWLSSANVAKVCGAEH